MHNHAAAIWACDFLPITDLCFRPLYAFFVIALGSRRVVHIGVTRHPTDAWVTQQLREAMPFGAAPGFLIRDNDAKYGPRFDRPCAPRGPTRPASASWGARGGSAWTTSSSSARRSCDACSARMWPTSTMPGPIKGSARRSQGDQRRRNNKVQALGAWSPCRSSAASITTIAALPNQLTCRDWLGCVK